MMWMEALEAWRKEVEGKWRYGGGVEGWREGR